MFETRSAAACVAALTALFAMAPARATDAPAPEIIDDGRTAGYVTLAWEGSDEQRFELQRRDPGESWVTAYEGPDRASTFTGLDDGDYAFRLRLLPGGDWSEPLGVTIDHHPLPRALGYFGAGAFMFAVLVGVLAWPLDDDAIDGNGNPS